MQWWFFDILAYSYFAASLLAEGERLIRLLDQTLGRDFVEAACQTDIGFLPCTLGAV
jgi:hypothetical protein